MKLPHRVPWASITELDQVCSWIYTNEYDIDSKELAVNRISAWKTTTSLPHALESALALLTAILQDDAAQNSSSYLSLRQSYATAVIRLVNGLVDPLQLGAYARSIASIAAQLGLPQWLVELRHAATHEDLPSLELLREAARESLLWLLHNYFLPTLNPSSTPTSHPDPPRPLAPILNQYKTLLKITTRDTTLQKQYKAEITALQRDLERWIAEAKVSANLAIGGLAWDFGNHPDSGNYDTKERWALDRFCDGLLEKGILVPLSKKKRVFPSDSFSPPRNTLLLWAPLLAHLQVLHDSFYSVLVNRITSFLLLDPRSLPDVQDIHYDASFDICLARWCAWLVDKSIEDNPECGVDLRTEIIVLLITSLGPGSDDIPRDRATLLLENLCTEDPELEAARRYLMIGKPLNGFWSSDDIQIMNERLNMLLSPKETSIDSSVHPEHLSTTISSNSFAPGWRLFDQSAGWKPCPMGVFLDVPLER